MGQRRPAKGEPQRLAQAIMNLLP